jgi:hypothetical protein
MANAADAYMKTHPNAPKNPNAAKDANAAQDANGAAASSGSPEEDKSSNGEDLEKKLEESAKAFNTATGTALLPVGWKHMRSDWHRIWSDLENLTAPRWSQGWWNAFDKDLGDSLRIFLPLIAGWFITACAISFGAPFWFDMLNKVMVVRSTIKPQEKSQPEGSKDKPVKA